MMQTRILPVKSLSLMLTVLLGLWVSSCKQQEEEVDPNDPNPIQLDCGSVSGTLTLENFSERVVDYVISCDLRIGEGQTLIIEPGTVIEMGSGSYIYVEPLGRIQSMGTADEPVVIRGQESLTQYWEGLRIESEFEDNRLSYTQLSDGGSGWNFSAPHLVYLSGSAHIAIDHCSMSNAPNGVLVGSEVDLISFTGNLIEDCEDLGLNMRIHHLDALAADNVIRNNGEEYVDVYSSGTLAGDLTWDFAAAPIRITQQVVVGENQSLTIRPGVTLLLNDYFSIRGTLRVEGTSESPVEFNGFVRDVPGYWSVLSFNTATTDNEISHAIISGGGNYEPAIGRRGSINIISGGLTLTNSIVSNGTSCGINWVASSGATLTESGNTFVNLEDADICVN